MSSLRTDVDELADVIAQAYLDGVRASPLLAQAIHDAGWRHVPPAADTSSAAPPAQACPYCATSLEPQCPYHLLGGER